MRINRKEEIIKATIKLSSKYGLSNISMSKIADEVGIKKASLYNHFPSKDSLIIEVYNYLRLNSLNNTLKYDVPLNLEDPVSLLYSSSINYLNMVQDKNMLSFYKIIYSERCYNQIAAKIITEETTKMINATKQLFELLESSNILHFFDLEIASASFAFTIHGFIDYAFDSEEKNEITRNKIKNYINWFCKIFKE